MNLLKEIINKDEYISHYGIPGMKWGVRKADIESYKKTAATSGMVKSELEATKKVGEATKNIIPEGKDKSYHPNYDNLSNEYMSSVVKRKNLEKNYAEAVGEMKVKKSKANIAREVFQSTIAALGVGIAVASLVQTHYSNKSTRLENKRNNNLKNAASKPKKNKK